MDVPEILHSETNYQYVHQSCGMKHTHPKYIKSAENEGHVMMIDIKNFVHRCILLESSLLLLWQSGWSNSSQIMQERHYPSIQPCYDSGVSYQSNSCWGTTDGFYVSCREFLPSPTYQLRKSDSILPCHQLSRTQQWFHCNTRWTIWCYAV